MRAPLHLLILAAWAPLGFGQIGATSVLSYTPGSGVNSLYTDPEQALGRPTVDTVFGMDLAPVAPVFGAWLPDEIVSIGAGGELVLGFDTPIEDDPANPYGIDLLVFGNAFFTTQGGNDYENHPQGTIVGSGLFPEPGRVSVSQDGTNWFEFTGGPFADGILPTLGRDWTGSAWGEPTDPTLPPPPGITPAMVAGMSVAELARRYRGGAGGTGFDLGTLDVPADPETGRKWARYVRIQCDALSTEIDAVTDVVPAPFRQRWEQTHFPWIGDPDEEKRYPHLAWTASGELELYLPASAATEPWRLELRDDPGEDAWQDLQAASGRDTVSGTLLRRRLELTPGGYGLLKAVLEETP